MEAPSDPPNPLADFLPVVPDSPIYDFSNFLTAPAVQETAAREGGIQVVNIPDAVIPSPLAEGITPGALLQIKEYLVGKGDGQVKIADGYAGNGHEVWASWKRAWDLWNNHYIEGRVNPVWIAEQFPKKKKDLDDHDHDAEQRAREAARIARRSNTTNPPPAPPNPNQRLFPLPGASMFDPPQPATQPAMAPTNQPTVTVQDTTWQPGTMSGSLHHRGHSLGNPPRPAAPGKKWEVRKAISTRPAAGKLSGTKWRGKSSGKRHMKPSSLMANVQRSPKPVPRANKLMQSNDRQRHPEPEINNVPLNRNAGKSVIRVDQTGGPEAKPQNPMSLDDPVRSIVPQWAMVEREMEGDLSEEYESMDELDREMEEYEIEQWVEVDDPNAKRQRTLSSNRDAANQRSLKGVKFAEGKELTGNELMEGFVTMPSPQKKTSPRKQKPAAQRDSSPVRTSPRKHVHSHAHTGAPMNPAMISMVTPSADITMGGTSIPSTRSAMPRPSILPSGEIINPPDPNEPMDMDPPPHNPPPMSQNKATTCLKDGRSGGWVPIKNFPQYRMPEDPGLAPDDPAQIAYDDLVFEDIVDNTVWRPRRVGEKMPKIDIDDDDPHKLHGVSDLEFDGGVDCGGEPYPVLRPMMEYVVRPDGVIKKMKVWDGVTGTIFNMPTKPLEPVPESDDPKIHLIKRAFTDVYRDGKLEEGPVFPLDIRRIPRVRESFVTSTPLLEAGETTLISREFNPSAPQYRYMEKADPYWVTEEQKKLRDNPTRWWPPGPDKHGAKLPTDDTIWKEELTKNDHFDARYFATNLQGGTLLINGQQVRKGCIAGPLPAFAVIESPGGQVSFWWGTGGRNYKAGNGNVDPASLERKWKTLRRTKGFEHAGMPAGKVWDMKIADRVRRERTGDDLEDDDQWKCWKKTKKAEEKADEDTVFNLYEEPQFAEKDDDSIELKWALARLHRRNVDPDIGRPSVIFPRPEAFWPGPVTAADAVDAPPKPISKDDIEHLWKTQGESAEMRQETYLALLTTRKEQEEQQQQMRVDSEIQASNKRRADGLLNPIRKRVREDREAKIQKEINERQQRATDSILAQNEAIAMENARVQLLQDKARLAAELSNFESTTDAFQQKLEADGNARRVREEEKRQQLNRDRALKNQPLLPSRDEFEMMRYGGVLRVGFMQQPKLTEAQRLQMIIRAEEANKRAEAVKKRQDEAQKRRDEEAKRAAARVEAARIAREAQAKKDAEDKAARDAQAKKDRERLEDKKFNKEQMQKQLDKAKKAEMKAALVAATTIVAQTAAFASMAATASATQPGTSIYNKPSGFVPATPLPLDSNTGTPRRQIQVTTLAELAIRDADLVIWKNEIRTTAALHIQDMQLWAGQEGFPSAIEVANRAGFATVQQYSNNRVRQTIRKHYGAEMIVAKDVPFDKVEDPKFGGRDLFAKGYSDSLRKKFYTMLEDLRDWEAMTRWVESPLSHVVGVSPDQTVHAEI